MKLLITAGPTREAIDPVRYLTNRSSGKMGYALAEAAAQQDHHVILISGPTCLDVPPNLDFLPVESAQDMLEAVQAQIGKVDAAVFAAAVADYRPAAVANSKIKKNDETMALTLVRNPDILASARSAMKFAGILIGFAAETENLEANARGKLERKGCDLVVANDVSQRGIGFESEDNEVLLVYPDRTEALERDSKEHLGHVLVDRIEELHRLRT